MYEDMKKIRQMTVSVYSGAMLPEEINGSVIGRKDAYLVAINGNLTEDEQAAAFLHEMLHIWHNDLQSDMDGSEIEDIRDDEIVRLLKIVTEWRAGRQQDRLQ